MKINDQVGRIVSVRRKPRRIISLVPSQTELLMDLQLEDQLVGVTKFCVHPANIRSEKTIVGGTKKVNYKKISALNPDLIICNKEENTAAMVERLEQIAPTYVSDIVSLDDNYRFIEDLGQLTGTQQKAQELIEWTKAAREGFLQTIATRTSKKVIYLIWKEPLMATGSATFIDTMIRENGWQNVIESSRYPEVTSKQLHGADLILLSTEPFPFTLKDAEAFQQQYNTPTHLVNGEFFSWYGSRLIKAYEYFATLDF